MPKRADDARTFLISVAAELAGMHAQTLRTYDRLGLVSPQRSSGGGRRYSQRDVDLLREVQRSSGGGRRYSQRDVDLLREVQRLSQDEGVNLAGIKRIIELTNQVEALQSRLKEMAAEIDELRAGQRRDVAVSSKALVVWQPRHKR
jgi:MerR family transcriptional regulator/heat shock protein HspR